MLKGTHRSCAFLHSSAALFAWFCMLEYEQTQEMLCYHLKGRGLLRKTLQVTVFAQLIGL